MKSPLNLFNTLIKKPYLSKIISNFGWLFFDKVFRLGVGLFVGAWVTRYLGPEQYGLLSYALAIIAFITPLTIFGLNELTVKSLVINPDNTQKILGNSFIIQAIMTLLSLFLILFSICYYQESLSRYIILIISLTLLFRPFDTVRYYFTANTQSKYIVWSENTSFILCSLTKVILIIMMAPFTYIVWVFFLDSLLTTLFLLLAYFYTNQSIGVWKVDWQEIKSTLKKAWPLAFAGLTIMVYMRIDQVMLGHMLNYSTVGIYSAATKLSEIWYFIPMIVASSVNPTLLSTRTHSEFHYYKQLKIVMSGLILVSLIIAVITTLFGHLIIHILYGESYKDATPVLIIHIWTGIFVCLGVMGGQWLVTEGLYKLHLYRSLCGAIVNIILNLLLIPIYGAIGAAIATLIAQIVSTFLFDLFNKKTRKIFWIKANALSIFHSYKELKNWK